MFLHIGNNVMLKTSEIIGIFNVSALQEDTKGRRFLNEVRQRNDIEDISEGKESTIILTNDKVFITRISSATLLSRSREDVRDTLDTTRRPYSAAMAQLNGSAGADA
jgi:hypothetical protein